MWLARAVSYICNKDIIITQAFNDAGEELKSTGTEIANAMQEGEDVIHTFLFVGEIVV